MIIVLHLQSGGRGFQFRLPRHLVKDPVAINAHSEHKQTSYNYETGMLTVHGRLREGASLRVKLAPGRTMDFRVKDGRLHRVSLIVTR